MALGKLKKLFSDEDEETSMSEDEFYNVSEDEALKEADKTGKAVDPV